MHKHVQIKKTKNRNTHHFKADNVPRIRRYVDQRFECGWKVNFCAAKTKYFLVFYRVALKPQIMQATKNVYNHDANLSMSQAYAPLIHKFAPETQQETDIGLRNKTEILTKRSKSQANIICKVDLPAAIYSICAV